MPASYLDLHVEKAREGLNVTLLCRENGPFNIYIYPVLVIYHILSFSTLHFVILVYVNLVDFHYFNPGNKVYYPNV
jgi:hypothetical protein